MLNLTAQERKVILFLLGVSLLGAGIDFLLKKNSRIKETFSLSRQIYKIDLNSADKDTLMSVSGVGEKLADRIIEYRRSGCSFQHSEDLKNIKGVTEARFERIKDYFIVR